MNLYLMLNHGSASSEEWTAYIQLLSSNRHLQGGSALADGISLQNSSFSAPISPTITGYILIQAESLDQAQSLVAQSPIHKSGGTVELFTLVRT